MRKADRRPSPAMALARQALRDARVRTAAFAYVFVAYAAVQPLGYRHAYRSLHERLAFAQSFGGSAGLRLLYGRPHDLLSAGGYAAWRVGGVLAVAAAAFGLLAAVRALRAEEDAGRADLVLAGVVGRRTANLAARAAIGAGIAVLWAAELTGFLVGGLNAAASAYLALATASVAAVCAGLGAVIAQVAPTRRIALGVGGGAIAVLFVLRVVPDTVAGAPDWLRWLTPLGWAEELRPFTGAQPLVLVLPAVTTAVLLAVAMRLAAVRDIGTGLLPARDRADPRLRLLSSPTGQALRSQSGALVAWTLAMAAFMFIFGAVAKSVTPADVSKSIQQQVAKLGTGSITTPSGYLAFVFLFVIVAVSAFACTQIGAAREAEAGQLETVLALPVSRELWLGGRLVLTLGGAAAISLAAAVLAWAGASVAGADVSLAKLLEAGANALPITMLFGGIAALAYAVAPRASAAIAYGALTVAFLWQLVGSLLGPPRWLLDLTPFAHVGLVPAQPFRPVGAVVMAGLGVAAALAALLAFRRRDLVGA